MPALTLAEASRIVEGAIAKAEELNIKIAAAVCDAGGHLLAFSRMDGAIWAAAYGPPGKAVSLICIRTPEWRYQPESPTIRAIVAGQKYMILGQGGLLSSEGARWWEPVGRAEAPASRTKTAPELE